MGVADPYKYAPPHMCYKFTVKDLIDLPVYSVKDLIIHAEHVVHSAWILF